MPKKSLSKKAKKVEKLKAALWIVIGISLIVFGAILVLLRSSITELSKDPSLTSLNNSTTLKVVQVINRNKNSFPGNLEECWNLKNPFLDCTEENKIEAGNYILKGGEDGYWLEGPFELGINEDIYILTERNIREALGGFMLADFTYNQLIKISYPEDNLITIHVETVNSDGDHASYEVTMEGYPVTKLEKNE